MNEDKLHCDCEDITAGCDPRQRILDNIDHSLRYFKVSRDPAGCRKVKHWSSDASDCFSENQKENYHWNTNPQKNSDGSRREGQLVVTTAASMIWQDSLLDLC